MAAGFDLNSGFVAIIKKPDEILTIPFDFGLRLNGDQLAGIPVVTQINLNTITASDDLSLDTPFMVDDRYVVVKVSGGTDYEDYRLTADCDDALGNHYQISGVLKVRSTT